MQMIFPGRVTGGSSGMPSTGTPSSPSTGSTSASSPPSRIASTVRSSARTCAKASPQMSYTRPSRSSAARGWPPAAKLTSLIAAPAYWLRSLRADGEGPSEGQGEEGREGGAARGRADGAWLRDEGGQPHAWRGGPPRRRGAPPDGGGRADLRRAGPDEGRCDEGRPGGLVHRHRRVPAGVPGAHPGEARRTARRRPARAVQEDAQGDRGR